MRAASTSAQGAGRPRSRGFRKQTDHWGVSRNAETRAYALGGLEVPHLVDGRMPNERHVGAHVLVGGGSRQNRKQARAQGEATRSARRPRRVETIGGT